MARKKQPSRLTKALLETADDMHRSGMIGTPARDKIAFRHLGTMRAGCRTGDWRGHGMTDSPDYIEVERQAHELVHSHGQNAQRYAAKLAAAALASGNAEAHQFWEAVEASLKPRDLSN